MPGRRQLVELWTARQARAARRSAVPPPRLPWRTAAPPSPPLVEHGHLLELWAARLARAARRADAPMPLRAAHRTGAARLGPRRSSSPGRGAAVALSLLARSRRSSCMARLLCATGVRAARRATAPAPRRPRRTAALGLYVLPSARPRPGRSAAPGAARRQLVPLMPPVLGAPLLVLPAALVEPRRGARLAGQPDPRLIAPAALLPGRSWGDAASRPHNGPSPSSATGTRPSPVRRAAAPKPLEVAGLPGLVLSLMASPTAPLPAASASQHRRPDPIVDGAASARPPPLVAQDVRRRT